LQPFGRCPRCGYVLRFNGAKYSCDFCGFPSQPRSIVRAIQELERGLKARVRRLAQELARGHLHRTYLYYPINMGLLGPCPACGINIPSATSICPGCGMPQYAAAATHRVRPQPSTTSGDERVLRYIVEHSGTISLSQAAYDLSISPEELRSSIERLKANGFLAQQ